MSKCTHWHKGHCRLNLFGGRPSAGTCARCPEYDGPLRGVGDVVHAVTVAVGLKPCKACQQRREAANAAIPFRKEALWHSPTTEPAASSRDSAT